MVRRVIAIGDIHGCSTALETLIRAIEPQASDLMVLLGDYVHRGPDTRGVLDQLVALRRRCELVPLLGNHDEVMLNARNGPVEFTEWLKFGGAVALKSYGDTGQLDLIPQAHFEFLETCQDMFETDTHFFVHANYQPDRPLNQQEETIFRWLSLRDHVPGPHCSGKIAVVGHTPQPDVLDLGHLIGLDTGCCRGGWLTALDLVSNTAWQSRQTGEVIVRSHNPERAGRV